MKFRKLAIFGTILTAFFGVWTWTAAWTGITRLAQAANSVNTPVVLRVNPGIASNDLDTAIIITGNGFTAELSGTVVITAPAVQVGTVVLAPVAWVNSTTLAASVPWGLDPGVYPVTVRNPDGQFSTLTDAFTVTQGLNVWTTGGPYGGAVTEMLIHPQIREILYVTVQAPNSASGIGLFRSLDGGNSWALVFPDCENNYHASDLVSPAPAVLYAAKNGVGLYRSDDSGDHWQLLTFPDNGHDLRVFAHPSDPQVVFAASDCGPACGKLFSSGDQGQHWEERTSGMTDTQITALAFDPANPQIVYAGTGSGMVYRSANGGQSWVSIGQPDQFISNLAVNPFGSHEVWAAGTDAGGHWGYLWKYTGSAWEQVLPGDGQNSVSSILFSTSDPGTIWIGRIHGAMQSLDGGQTWASFGPSLYSINTLSFDPANEQILYLGYNGTGVSKTTDGGATWSEANEGLAGVYPNGLAVHPSQPGLAYVVAHGTGVFKTTNGGSAWLRLPGDNQWPRAPVVDPDNPQRLYVGSTNSIDWTEDDGQTWHQVFPAPPPEHASCCRVEVESLLPTGQPGRLVLGVGFADNSAASFSYVGGGLYTSADSGASWNYVNVTQPISPVISLAADPSNPLVLYAGTGSTVGGGTGVWKSTDGGTSWNPAGLVGLGVVGVAVDPHHSEIVYASTRDSYWQKFYVSNDGGQSWDLVFTGDGGMDHLLVLATQPTTLYRYGYNGLVRSNDGGIQWERAAGALGTARVGALAAFLTENRVITYIGTAGGTSSELRSALALPSEPAQAGVYRTTQRLANQRQYLPLVRR